MTSDAIGMRRAEEFVSNNGLTPTWDEVTCQNYAALITDKETREVWLEDEKSMEVKLNIMYKYGVAGIAAWRLGFEKPEIWDIIETYVNTPPNPNPELPSSTSAAVETSTVPETTEPPEGEDGILTEE